MLKAIEILTADEHHKNHKKELHKHKHKEVASFDIKPASPKLLQRRASSVNKVKLDSNKPLMEMPDATKVCDIFTYRKNEVKVDCKFQTLLEVFLDQVTAKTKELEEKSAQAERELKLSEQKSDLLNTSQKHQDALNAPLLEQKSPVLPSK